MDRYLIRAREEIETAVAGITTPQLVRPDRHHWTIAEILEHLTLAFTANASFLEKILSTGQLKARPPRVRQRLARIMVVELGYFPRVKAPEITVPRGSIAPERSVPAIGEALHALDRALTRAAERFGDNVLVANHPYFAGMTVRQWRKFHWRHTRHHMHQIRRRLQDR